MIEVENAGFKFNGSGFIFRHHSFKMEAGGILAVLGPNGRGKTTLLKTIIGLLPLNEGRIHTQGHIGYVPQFSTATFPYSVLDMVVMGRARHIGLLSHPKRADYDAARQALDELGVGWAAHRTFFELSGGERQLVLIARALASECDLLILDEPASALDFKNQGLILSSLQRLSRRQKLTIVLTTHYPQHAVHMADRVLMMYSPEEFLFGSTSEIMTDPRLKRLYEMDVRNITFEHNHRRVKTVVPVFV